MTVRGEIGERSGTFLSSLPMRPSVPAVSVVVPTWNEAAGLEAFLRQFERQTLPRSDFEIVVVDGGSADGTREIARRFAEKVLVQKRRGIGGARNDGVDAAAGAIIATTDADCVVPPDWLAVIRERFEDPGVVAAVGPDSPIEGGWKPRFVYFFLRGFIRAMALAGLYTTGGTNTAVRRASFLRVGGYRNLVHSDDVDLGFRLKALGRIVYDPRLHVRLSVRRLEKSGYLRTLITWAKGDLYLLLGKEIRGRGYAKQDY
jgi:glycosyltransferase involved in cell wall biosynthesis